MIPYGRQFIDEEDIEAVVEVLKSDFITQGPKVKEFEDKLARYCGAKYCVVFNSGTSALLGAYYACGISEGDEVITSPITFVATTNMILVLRAKPVFVDVEPDTGNINSELIEGAITDKTKAIVPVHYAGHPVDMEKIRSVADRYGLRVIEDACHALGAEYKGSKVGSCEHSDAAVFSFHPVKHITTGEGGAVLTNDEDIYQKLLLIRNHGINREKFMYEPDGDWYYEVQALGFNFRLTDIQASLGISQLKKLDRFVRRRREIANYYANELGENPFFDLPVEKPYTLHSYHLYPVRLKDIYADIKREIVKKLREEGIGVQVHYIPVYRHPLYRELGYHNLLLPNAENFYKRVFTLPIYPSMKEEELKLVVGACKDAEVFGV
ncbi:UDP-4-amino-4,6-dideoxy-N-acetyl-beta-L-altrosamine transaminase [Hydrogenivirga sp. 128-5-R1-1]|uniref:UDP-4-amino-4, 6-dideoxy-N-acetyl-beta-L-altrosamine transaminase n=1 Tax=Hydrogenivirga sp. 128-5-R1-1 TaxID=392423 RepID=UPI00015EF86E|nr:UDP-4-amino-4,6-dideoxy-N-acetyl-beta-L-altrosamine transaminase [Hydrogenivirga sp. 128-5-R1-1]EDP74920.1 DegT/DnrJ/EryC1/StrS aminotransferase [Hydrogenivirga sp. 128-5-R1-1]